MQIIQTFTWFVGLEAKITNFSQLLKGNNTLEYYFTPTINYFMTPPPQNVVSWPPGWELLP